MPKTKAQRDETKYRLLPPLDAETYQGLKANIALNGIQIPVVRDEDGYILDGFARAQIAEELGYECPSVTVTGLTNQIGSLGGSLGHAPSTGINRGIGTSACASW